MQIALNFSSNPTDKKYIWMTYMYTEIKNTGRTRDGKLILEKGYFQIFLWFFYFAL